MKMTTRFITYVHMYINCLLVIKQTILFIRYNKLLYLQTRFSFLIK